MTLDYAHKETDKILWKIEKRLNREYSKAAKKSQKKVEDYFQRFAEQDAKMSAKLKSQEITLKEYTAWRQSKMLTGKRYEELKDVLAKDYTNTNKIAMRIVGNELNDVYALNMNYATYQIEKQAMLGTSFTLYDHKTVERLIRENPKLLPKVDVPKDLRWNKSKINSCITQAVLRGDSIPNIANNLMSVTNMIRSSAIRNARTMMTSAENAGRIESYKRAESMGIELEQMWVATLDDRTRHEHRELDGQKVKVGEKFKVAGDVDDYEIEYPGDPEADPEMVYNCRCTLVPVVSNTKLAEDFDGVERNSKLGDMTYEQWKKGKQ